MCKIKKCAILAVFGPFTAMRAVILSGEVKHAGGGGGGDLGLCAIGPKPECFCQ